MPLKIQRENSEDAHLSPAKPAIQMRGGSLAGQLPVSAQGVRQADPLSFFL